MALEVVKRAESPAEKAKRQKSQQKELVQSPMFQFSAYPTPSGTVLRSRSPPGRAKTIKTRDNPITERAASAVNFEPPFNPVSQSLFHTKLACSKYHRLLHISLSHTSGFILSVKLF